MSASDGEKHEESKKRIKKTKKRQKTQNFLIESAFFHPSIIKGKARRYGFQTDASQRFERGVDFNLHEDALKEALSIIREIYQADISNVETIKNKYFPRKKLLIIYIVEVIVNFGSVLKENTIRSILNRLEKKLIKQKLKIPLLIQE